MPQIAWPSHGGAGRLAPAVISGRTWDVPGPSERVDDAGDLLALHAQAGIELRLVPNLWPVIDAIVASGLEFSIIRKANALPRASTSAA